MPYQNWKTRSYNSWNIVRYSWSGMEQWYVYMYRKYCRLRGYTSKLVSNNWFSFWFFCKNKKKIPGYLVRDRWKLKSLRRNIIRNVRINDDVIWFIMKRRPATTTGAKLCVETGAMIYYYVSRLHNRVYYVIIL